MFAMQKRTNKYSSKTYLRFILPVLLSGFWILAQAQVNKDRSNEPTSAHMKSRDKESPAVILEHEIPVTIQLPPIQLTSCQAYISIQSHQRDTLARVVSTIEQKTCTTSKGEYELSVGVKDENGVYRDLLFSEVWEQKDDSPMEFSQDYPIGENVTLWRLMAKSVRCECTDL